MYTLANIETAPSYTALIRNNFTNDDVVSYYATNDPMTRKMLFATIKNRTATPTAIRQICSNSLSTQVCTKSNIRAMAMDYMNRDFEYRGTTYNMIDMGWEFAFINTRNAFGRCHRRVKRNRFTMEQKIVWKQIQISQWLIANSKSTFEEWVDTVLHEIAHAIDVERRGMSDHSSTWKAIARSVGARPERTTDVKISHENSKYTNTCINCGDKTASHKRNQRGRTHACTPCCKKYNNNKFSYDYKLIQTQNY